MIIGYAIYFTAFDICDEIWFLLWIHFIALLIIAIFLSILFDDIKFTATWSRKYCKCKICGNKCFVLNLIIFDVMSNRIWKDFNKCKTSSTVTMKIYVFDVYPLAIRYKKTLITLLKIFSYHFPKSFRASLLVFAYISICTIQLK